MANFEIKTVSYHEYVTQYSHSPLKGARREPINIAHSKDLETEILPSVYIDRNFQRNFVWNRARRRAYNKAVLKRKSGTPITIACIESCLRYSRLVNCEDSIQKFEELLGWGYKYISLDGQNRSLTMQEFAEKATSLTMGETEHVCTLTNESINLSNRLLKDFPPSIRGEFLQGTKVPVCVYTDYTYSELAAEFRDLNSSDNLNPMEWRNSYQTYFSTWIRSQVDVHKDFFVQWKGAKEYETFSNRMDDRELYSIFSLYLGGVFKDVLVPQLFDANNVGIKTKKVLDYLFECGESIQLNSTRCPYDPQKLTRVNKIMTSMTMAAPHLKRIGKINKWQVWAFLSVFEWMHDNGHTISTADMREFVEMTNQVIKEERHDSKQQHSADEQIAGDDLPKQGYFFGQLETIGEIRSRKGIKSTIDDLMTNNLKTLPVQISQHILPLEVDYAYEEEFTY